LDGEVLALREAKEQEWTSEQDQVVKNGINEFKKHKGEYEKVKNSLKLVENYVAANSKAIIHYKKRKGNAAVPSNVPQLKARYGETKDRPDLTMKTHLADRGFEGDDVERILCSTTNEIVTVENNSVRTEKNLCLDSHRIWFVLAT
jgi:hypothetical protein